MCVVSKVFFFVDCFRVCVPQWLDGVTSRESIMTAAPSIKDRGSILLAQLHIDH